MLAIKLGKNASLRIPSLLSTKVRLQLLTRNQQFFTKQQPSSKPKFLKKWWHSHSGTLGEDISLKKSNKITSYQLLKHMFNCVWPKDKWNVKANVLLTLGLLVASKVLNVYVPFYFKDIIDYLNINTPIKEMGDNEKVFMTTAALIIGYGLARAGASLFSEARNAIFAFVAQRSIRDLAKDVFSHLHKLDLSFHLSRQTGALTKVIDRGTRGMSTVLSLLVFNIAPTIFEVALVSGILYQKFGIKYALVTIGCITSYTIFTLLVTQWRTKYRIMMNKADNEMGSKAVDSLINFETVKYFNNEDYELKRYDESLKKYEAASIKTATSLAVLNWGQNLIFSGGLVAIMMLAAQGVIAGQMTVGDLVMCNTLLFQLSLPLNFLGAAYREVRQSFIDMEQLYNLKAIEPSIKDIGPNVPHLMLTQNNSSIVFDNVHFGYSIERKILDGLSFDVPSGKKIAIVGGSGSGKSTIVRLLFRYYDPHEGRVLVANQDIREVNLDSLRRSIGVVPQDTVLFHETILYNLHYGNFSATKEDVFEAAKKCDLHNAIMRMPKQYDTLVGERGLKLSGGEKQRVAITRTLLKNPTFFVYDEATSSLDSITENNILNSLKTHVKNKTTLIIAHRLSTITDADEIFVLEKGKVSERGTHASLITKPSSLYFHLWQKQHDKL